MSADSIHDLKGDRRRLGERFVKIDPLHVIARFLSISIDLQFIVVDGFEVYRVG